VCQKRYQLIRPGKLYCRQFFFSPFKINNITRKTQKLRRRLNFCVQYFSSMRNVFFLGGGGGLPGLTDKMFKKQIIKILCVGVCK
jgi:hypothetical protein